MTDDPLWKAIKRAHERWSPGETARFPLRFNWEPQSAAVGTENRDVLQTPSRSVPRVPGVPTENHKIGQDASAARAEEGAEDWEERAAILEYDAGFDRAEAERSAATDYEW